MTFRSCSLQLGVGVGLRPAHYDVFLHDKPRSVNWVEVISENFMSWRSERESLISRPLQILGQIRGDYPVALHGVSLSIGSADRVNRNYVRRLKALIKRIDPVIVSDHLCWTGVDGQNTHDLLPIPYTQTYLKLIRSKVDEVQNLLGRPILLENPSSYVSFAHSEMTEWDFLSQIARHTGCRILLDLNNVFVSAVNHGFDPNVYINSIPLHYVQQIHLAGHSRQGGILVDTHDAPVCREVWDLYRISLGRFGFIPTMIERDAQIPEWHELETELKMISEIRSEKGRKREHSHYPKRSSTHPRLAATV